MRKPWIAVIAVTILQIARVAPARAQERAASGSALRTGASTGLVPPVADAGKLSGVDLGTLRPQMQLFADYLNRDLQANLENPFALLQDPKGMYLPGFGVAFHMEINLHPLRVLNPFDLRPYTPEELAAVRASKVERIGQLKTQLSDMLLAHGTELAALPADQNIAVVVHLFNLPSEQTDGLPMELVIQITRGALQQSKDQKMAADDFRRRVTSLEF